MKKILSILALFFAFTFSASAQTESKSQTSETLAKNDVLKVSKVIALEESMKKNLHIIFLKKYDALNANQTLTKEEAKGFSENVDTNLKAALSAEDIKRLKSVTGLYDKLIYK
ncbi:hypothetical protein SAMN05660845_0383 [Flavobacterium swingsii]|jgi:hypothetical protein|uniref:Uncharacterized protein n=1 Tax=Flavobacterium swingsii TaxID=498292 RepID=A0A1I0VGI4_9FLAO|nr:hypothetical protein [Flavobacterium swingsii]SFA75421.1 hypothetical protein SAMN05660845_0383 [Flavobacterium swingsii]